MSKRPVEAKSESGRVANRFFGPWHVHESLTDGSRFKAEFEDYDSALKFAQGEIDKNRGVGALCVSDKQRAIFYDVLND